MLCVIIANPEDNRVLVGQSSSFLYVITSSGTGLIHSFVLQGSSCCTCAARSQRRRDNGRGSDVLEPSVWRWSAVVERVTCGACGRMSAAEMGCRRVRAGVCPWQQTSGEATGGRIWTKSGVGMFCPRWEGGGGGACVCGDDRWCLGAGNHQGDAARGARWVGASLPASGLPGWCSVQGVEGDGRRAWRAADPVRSTRPWGRSWPSLASWLCL